jgi:23S rRNA pseudouridine1911/1915/1917 synthase
MDTDFDSRSMILARVLALRQAAYIEKYEDGAGHRHLLDVFAKKPAHGARMARDCKQQHAFMQNQSHTISDDQVGITLAACLRSFLPGQSWEQVRRLVVKGRVKIDEDVCRDWARRVRAGQTVQILARAVPVSDHEQAVKLRHLDEHIVVVEKPAGVCTVRHPLERAWSETRKARVPTLEDLVPRLIARTEKRSRARPASRLRVVHRLDKETSGLVVFARTVPAERGLGKQFHAHTVTRRYLAIVPGRLRPQRVITHLVRDRGDGRRGSTRISGQGKQAVTHLDVVEELPAYAILSCRLETGRTHQIRIHLAELGHPVCGERVYNRKPSGEALFDSSKAPRLALHAAELGFVHPVTGASLHWTMPLPSDLQDFVDRLRNARGGHGV